MARYRMTPRRRAALRKAQQASARNRRRFGTKTKIAAGILAAGAGAVAYHKITGSSLSVHTSKIGSHVSAAGRRNGTFRIRSGTIGIRHQSGGTRKDFVYTHGRIRSAKSVVLGSQVERSRSAIPKYNPNSKRSWPAVAFKPQNDERYQPASQWESAVLGKKFRKRAV